MKTKLFISSLEVFANHGLFEEENKLGQKFIFDIECELIIKKRCLVMKWRIVLVMQILLLW